MAIVGGLDEPHFESSDAVAGRRPGRNNDDPFLRYAGRFDRPIADVRDRLRASGAVPADVARSLGLPAAAVEGPASFFADFSAPRGRRHIRVCGAAACFAATGGGHVAEVGAALGGYRR